MNRLSLLLGAAVTAVSGIAHADLFYGFDTGVEGFQDVTWQAASPAGWSGGATIRQNHTESGWQQSLTKDFSSEAGGGSANQLLEMQALANTGVNARFAFDVMIDGGSFPPGQSLWYEFSVGAYSDGSDSWILLRNLFPVSSWHVADDPTLIVQHVDLSFSDLGWQPGDTLFQFSTVANSAFTVNFYLDNFHAYAVPEPSVLALAGFGSAMLLIRRRRR